MTADISPINLGRKVRLELLGQGDLFRGIGAVCIANQMVRSGERPMFVEIRNPAGIEMVDYSLVKRTEGPEGVRLGFAMKQREAGPMEWMVHEVRARYSTADWSEPARDAVDTSLELELRPVEREIGGRHYEGFSYRYHYRSADVPIYKLLDRGTWEIGGRAMGNELWMRSCFVPSICKVESVEQFHSTEWYIPDCANPNVFQFLPLQTELQGFTFTAAKAGVLLTWANDVAHIRSLLEKPRGKDVQVHFHEHCGDLGQDFSTAPVEVLWSPGERNRVELANDYHAMAELVGEALHERIGMRRERGMPYGHIEEWEPADLERYRKVGLPKLQQAGIKTVFLASHFENNMNTWGVGNMCCTVDYKVAESVGEEKLRAFCADAKAGGVAVEMWANTSISTLTPMFDSRNGTSDRIRFLPRKDSIMEAIDPATSFVRNPSHAIEADHYTPVFAVLNLRDAKVRAYWLRRWREAQERIGLGGIFLDSSFNLSSDKFHYVQNTEAGRGGATADQTDLLGRYRPEHEPPQAILSQYRAHLELMVEMQRMGYSYCNEDLGVFGINRHGPALPMRLESLFLWANCLAEFDPLYVQEKGLAADDVFFQGIAYRVMWSIHWNIKQDVLTFRYSGPRSDEDLVRPWHSSILHAFNRVENLMQERTILPGEAGVIYRAGDRQVLWAFRDFDFPLERNTRVSDVLGEETFAASDLQAKRNHLYLLSPS